MPQGLNARLIAGALLLAATVPAQAFCGFYVAKADTGLFNEASKVAIARDGKRTVVTMASDYQGDASEFAMVVPVNEVPQRGQLNVANPALMEHIDAYTAPRLVEYYDKNPCDRPQYEMLRRNAMPMAAPSAADAIEEAKALGVTIEAEYEVGEYDILILSAEESNGLITWLNQNGYRIPEGAEETVGAYLRRDMKFFVAKVNLERHDGNAMLRPIQVAYEDEEFMLPIRLGTVNARGKQELFVFAMTRTGRVETTNYRTVKIPSNIDVPIYIKDEFGEFYKDMFRHQVDAQNGKAVFLEYAWDMAWCDPCAAEPLSRSELRELGVMWLDDETAQTAVQPGRPSPRIMPRPQGPAVNVFVTRLHLRYDADSFPEDLKFQSTGDRSNYQGRYVLRHAWRGDFNQCEEAQTYANALVERWGKEAQTLAELTGRDIEVVRARMREAGLSAAAVGVETPTKRHWWDRLWGSS